MIAQVVPIARIRRDTSWWSYHLSSQQHCLPGSLVVVPFRGRPTLGIVWHIEDKDQQAKEPVTTVLTELPLIRTPQRALIEYLSQTGLCSLSTALCQWLPRQLSNWPLSAHAQALLREYNQDLPTLKPIKQQAIILPSHYPSQEDSLQKKFSQQLVSLFTDQSERAQLENWFAIALGKAQIALGREQVIFAPWFNLQKITLIDPENIAYYHEQIPYLSLIDVVKKLSLTCQAELIWRSHLPLETTRELYGDKAQGVSFLPQQITLLPFQNQSLFSSELIEGIQQTLRLGKKVIILYNAHDQWHFVHKEGKEEKLLIPGIETLRRQLAQKLNRSELPPEVLLDTRTLFTHPHQNVGLTVHLTFDMLLNNHSLANLLHGVSDIGHLLSYACPCLIQTKHFEHPLVQALQTGHIDIYLLHCLQEQQTAGLPPFGQHIVCSIPENETHQELAHKTYKDLINLPHKGWEISYPFVSLWRKKPYIHLLLHSFSPQERLPILTRKYLVSLPRPWRVQYNPWYLL